jgi:hypothetical protein
VEAPRDFESILQPQAISHHFQLLKNQLLIKLIWNNLGQFGLFTASMVTFWLHIPEGVFRKLKIFYLRVINLQFPEDKVFVHIRNYHKASAKFLPKRTAVAKAQTLLASGMRP